MCTKTMCLVEGAKHASKAQHATNELRNLTYSSVFLQWEILKADIVSPHETTLECFTWSVKWEKLSLCSTFVIADNKESTQS